MLIPLLQNVSMLLAIVVVYAVIAGRRSAFLLRAEPKDIAAQVQTGAMIGLIAVAMILTPVRYDGLLLDARSVLLSLAGLFLGLVPSVLALAIAALYRVYTGGPGVLPGMIVMSVSVIIGLLWRRLRNPKPDQLSLAELYLLGLVVHLAVIALGFIPAPALNLTALRSLVLPLLLIFPVAEAVVGGLLVRVLRHEALARDIKVSEERYRLLADNVTDIILQHDLEGRIAYISPSVRQLGYEPESLIGLVRFEFIHPDDRDALVARMRAVAAGGDGGGIEARVRKADGRWVWIESRPTPIRDDQGRIVGILSVCRDFSAREKAEAALREVRAEMARVARISALGAFSASIAHEINQPLAALVTNSEVAQRLLAIEPPDLDKVGRAIERSARDARRASDIIARMRSLTGKRPVKAADFQLAEAIEEVLALAHPELQRWNVAVETALCDGALRVHGDRIQIQQVVLNLIQNAIEAMREIPEAERRLQLRCDATGAREVRVEVEDRGPGLDPGSTETMFELLVTTKEGGSGLGLAISKSIIEAHGGAIWAAPAELRGAVFRFQLPRAS